MFESTTDIQITHTQAGCLLCIMPCGGGVEFDVAQQRRRPREQWEKMTDPIWLAPPFSPSQPRNDRKSAPNSERIFAQSAGVCSRSETRDMRSKQFVSSTVSTPPGTRHAEDRVRQHGFELFPPRSTLRIPPCNSTLDLPRSSDHRRRRKAHQSCLYPPIDAKRVRTDQQTPA